MKSVIVLVLTSLSIVYAANAGNFPVEFRGYMEFNGEQLFSLKSTKQGGSAWVRLGQGFCNGKLIDYDPKNESISFSCSGSIFEVKIFESNVSEELADKYVATGRMDSVNVNRRTVTETEVIPRVLAARIYNERETVKYKDGLVDYNDAGKNTTSSNPEGISRVTTLNADELEKLGDNDEISSQLGLGNGNRYAVTRRGSIPRVPTSRTREEKEAIKQAINNRNQLF